MGEINQKIGKFDSPESLLKAYKELEAEFTKRSQKLKELTEQNKKLSEQVSDPQRLLSCAKELASSDDFINQYILTQEKVKRKVIDEYLYQLNKNGNIKVLGGNVGSSVLTPPAKPSSLSEAKKLADMIINS